MKRRMIDAGLWANEKYAAMPAMARLLQVGLITLADDQGRMKAHPAYLRSQIFPYEDLSVDDIGQWLELIMANGTLVIYEVNGKEYLQLVNWWEYQTLQYASPSEHPRPHGWQDRIRYNAKGGQILTCNWRTPKGDTPADTCDQDGNPLAKSPKPAAPTPAPAPTPDPDPIALVADKPKPQYRQAAPGEYLPGLPNPRRHQERNLVDHTASQREKLGIGPEQLTVLTDAVLAGMNATQVAALDTDLGSGELRQAQEAALALAGLGHKTAEAVSTVFATWYTHDWRGQKGESPTYKQLVEHGRTMDRKVQARQEAKPSLTQQEKEVILANARNALTSIRTAQQFKGAIQPEWQRAIDKAKAVGVM